jgi:hypothetical protein
MRRIPSGRTRRHRCFGEAQYIGRFPALHRRSLRSLAHSCWNSAARLRMVAATQSAVAHEPARRTIPQYDDQSAFEPGPPKAMSDWQDGTICCWWRLTLFLCDCFAPSVRIPGPATGLARPRGRLVARGYHLPLRAATAAERQLRAELEMAVFGSGGAWHGCNHCGSVRVSRAVGLAVGAACLFAYSPRARLRRSVIPVSWLHCRARLEMSAIPHVLRKITGKDVHEHECCAGPTHLDRWENRTTET